MAKNPIIQFDKWFSDACKADMLEPNAMALSTISDSTHPSVRIVLLKAYDEKGFIFFTSYDSNKAKEIEKNPHTALLFAWLKLERQVKITGTAKKISIAESLKYFSNRTDKMGSWIAEKNGTLKTRIMLEKEFGRMLENFKNKKRSFFNVWGGYRVIPYTVEFWQGYEDKLYERFLYTKTKNGWKIDKI